MSKPWPCAPQTHLGRSFIAARQLGISNTDLRRRVLASQKLGTNTPRKPTQFPGRRTGFGEIPQARRHRSRTRIFCTMSAVAGAATTPLRTMAPAARAAVTHVRSDRSRTAARRSRMSLDIRSGGRISPRIPARPGSSRPTVSSSVIAMDVILCPPHIDDGTGRGRSATLANEIGEKDVASRRGTLEGNLGGESSNCSAVDGMDPAAVRSAPGNTCSV